MQTYTVICHVGASTTVVAAVSVLAPSISAAERVARAHGPSGAQSNGVESRVHPARGGEVETSVEGMSVMTAAEHADRLLDGNAHLNGIRGLLVEGAYAVVRSKIINEMNAAMVLSENQRIAELEAAMRLVIARFEQDEAQGYRSRDRQFAIDILCKAMKR